MKGKPKLVVRLKRPVRIEMKQDFQDTFSEYRDSLFGIPTVQRITECRLDLFDCELNNADPERVRIGCQYEVGRMMMCVLLMMDKNYVVTFQDLQNKQWHTAMRLTDLPRFTYKGFGPLSLPDDVVDWLISLGQRLLCIVDDEQSTTSGKSVKRRLITIGLLSSNPD